MEVLILSKTHIGTHACVGGVELSQGEFIRLMNGIDEYQPGNTEFEPGQIWDISFKRINNHNPPHIEDVIVTSNKFIREQQNIAGFIQDAGYKIWAGSPDTLFDGLLGWTGNGSGYLSKNQKLPENSVGFWIPDKDLTYAEDHQYNYPVARFSFKKRRLKYVGFEEAREIIPANTLIRVSLAKWWRPRDSDMELRCYLQLSGWY